MLKTTEYLRSGKTLEDLKTELGISSTKHEFLPLVILNYSQIDSPKTHPVVRECRGLVLHSEDYELVARAFPRFFNIGEVADEEFDWESCSATEKVDGSLVLIYHFNGKWMANTRGSFGNWNIFSDEYTAKLYNQPVGLTWQQAFCKGMGINDLQELNSYLDPQITYICEFCSLWNKVIREYKEPKMYLLTQFVGELEIGPRADLGIYEWWMRDPPLFTPIEEFNLKSPEACAEFVSTHPETTFEGVVTKDKFGRRRKCKNPRYLSLHHLKGNGVGFLPKYLMPYILSNETDELLVYFPEAKGILDECKEKVDNCYLKVEELWKNTWQIENQKEFALSIVGKTPFTGILFNIRKELGKNQTLEDLKRYWRNNGDTIIKVLFK